MMERKFYSIIRVTPDRSKAAFSKEPVIRLSLHSPDIPLRLENMWIF